MDQLTLGLIGGGSVFLLLWYGSRAVERRREIKRLVKGVPAMADSRKTKNDLMGNLPATIDEPWIVRRVEENLGVFRQTPRLLNQWLIALRDRYTTPWEVGIIKRAEEKLQARLKFMKTAVAHEVAVQTFQDDVKTGVLEKKTERIRAEADYDVARTTTPMDVETRTLQADTARRGARTEHRAAEEAEGALQETLAQVEPLKAQTAVLEEQERHMDLQVKIAKHKQAIRDSQPAPPPPPPRPKPSPDERFKQGLEDDLGWTDLKSWALKRIADECQRKLAEIKAQGYGEGSEVYRQVLNEYEDLKGRIIGRR